LWRACFVIVVGGVIELDCTFGSLAVLCHFQVSAFVRVVENALPLVTSSRLFEDRSFVLYKPAMIATTTFTG
jgi:hypothetical protein